MVADVNIMRVKDYELELGELPLGDTKLLWLLFFFPQVLLPLDKIGSWLGVNMLTVNSTAHKKERQHMLESVYSSRMAQIKFTLTIY